MSYNRMKTRRRLMATVLCGAMMVSVTGCGGSAAGQIKKIEKQEILTESDEDFSEVLENSIGLSENTDSEKDETVYVIADASGNKQEVIVSEWLKNTDGADTITDSSTLSDIENVKGDETFTQDGDTITWQANGNSIYYQGTSDAEVPVEVKVTYYLDDKVVTSQELAGQSGKVKMRFEYINNSKSGDVYTPFVMATGMILSNDSFSNITVENGQVINDGNNSIVVGMGMPGLEDSLDLQKLDVDIPDYFEVTADCTDFSLDMTMTVASTGFLSKDEDSTGLEDAEDEINDLLKTYSDGMDSLVSGIKEYTDGVSSVADGVDQVKTGAEDLYAGSLTLAQGVDDATSGVKTLKTAYEGDNGLLSGSKKISDGLAQLNKAVSGISLPTDTKLSDSQKKSIEKTITTNITNNLTKNAESIAAGVDKDAVTKEAQTNGAAAAPSAETVTAQAKEDAPSSDTIKAQATEAGTTAATASAEKYITEMVNAYATATGETDPTKLAALQQAFTSVYGEVYAEAYGAAYSSAYSSAYATGYGTAYKSAFTAGYGSAYETAYTSAYTTAYQTAYISGYSTAYQDGLSYGANLVLSKLSSYSDQLETLKTSVDQLATGASTLNSGLKQMYSGTTDLYDGMVKLNGGAGTLSDGAGTLKTGVGTLADGTGELTSASGELVDGSNELKDGTDEIVDKVNETEEDLNDLSDKCDAVIAAGEAYQSYGGISDDMSGNVKFIIKTDSITAE